MLYIPIVAYAEYNQVWYSIPLILAKNIKKHSQGSCCWGGDEI